MNSSVILLTANGFSISGRTLTDAHPFLFVLCFGHAEYYEHGSSWAGIHIVESSCVGGGEKGALLALSFTVPSGSHPIKVSSGPPGQVCVSSSKFLAVSAILS